ncbi:MAG: hypothetical protein M1338_00335 [Patescibacteria group bacterium]|nr:hypothetical protein [Patescibacteria group bacterium]
MEILKRIGWGVLIWVIMFVWVTVLMFVFKLTTGWLTYVLSWLASILLAWLAANKSNLKNVTDALLTGLIWIVVGVALDWIVTTKFSPQIFSSWSLWVGYGLLLIVALFNVKKK